MSSRRIWSVSYTHLDVYKRQAYDDALAYAQWAGKALPSEEQWELAAATGGADRNVPIVDGKPQANYYQGVFPVRDMGTDGFTSRAPVACFPADKHGVHDLIGNVWEWTASAIDPDRNVIKLSLIHI